MSEVRNSAEYGYTETKNARRVHLVRSKRSNRKVCKTFIRRFDPGPRLQQFPGKTHNLNHNRSGQGFLDNCRTFPLYSPDFLRQAGQIRGAHVGRSRCGHGGAR
jgi:hypothetical protein